MEKRLLYQYIWVIIGVLLASGVEVMAQSITAIGPPSPNPCVSPGGALSIPFSTTGIFGVSNVFSLELSDNGGSFPATPLLLSSRTVGPSTPTTIILAGAIPANITAGSYRVRVVSTSPVRTSSLATINVSPGAPVAGLVSPASQICTGATVSLTATGTNLKWFNPSGNLVSTSGTYTFPVTGSGNLTYTVTQLVGLCESPVRTVTFTVTPKSPDPLISSQPSYCQGITGEPLNATGTNLRWYGTNVNNPSPSTTPTVPPTTSAGAIGPFYVSQNTTGCESNRVGINVTVNAATAAPTVTATQVFCQGTGQQTLSPSGAAYRWYNANGTVLANNGAAPVISLSTPGSTTYLVSALNNGCESAAKSTVVALVNASPAAIAPVSMVYCEAARPAALTVSGTNVRWYSDASGNNQIAAPAPPQVAGTYTYYVRQFDSNGCGSSPSGYVVRVASTPTAPGITTDLSRCVGDSPRSLSATGTNLTWFDNAGAALSGAPSPPTSTSGQINYSVQQATTDGCISPRATATVTVNAIPLAPSVVAPNAICQGTTAPSLSASGQSLRWYGQNQTGGTPSSSPSSININQVGTVNYYVSQVVNGCESPRAAIPVTVKDTPNAPGVTDLAFCQNTPAPALLATPVTNAVIVWYTVASGGNSSTTAPSVLTTVAQTYSFYPAQRLDGCESPRATLQVRVKPIPAAPSTTPLELCHNAPSQAIKAQGENLKYYEPNGSSTTTPISPPTTNPGVILYKVTQTVDNCESSPATLSVTVNSIPAAPSVLSPNALCEGTSSPPSLTASGAGNALLRWYGQNQTGGTPSSSPSSINVNQVGTVNYYVSQVVNGCESSRAAIPVTVKDTPNAPGVSNVAFCQGTQAPTLTATPVANATIVWYTASSGGNATEAAPGVPVNNVQTYAYYPAQRLNGCEGPRAILQVRVKQTPGSPITTPLELCNNSPSQPIQAQGSNLKYYEPGGNVTGNAPAPPTNTVGTITYQVSQSLEECEGPKAALNVRIKPLPSVPGVGDVSYCQTQQDQPAQSVSPVSAQGQNLRWYNTDGNSFGSAPTPQIDQARTYSFQVSQTVENCEGPRATLNVFVRTTSSPVVSTSSVTYCRDDQAVPLRATAEAGAQLRWIDPNGSLTNDAPTPLTQNATPPGGRVFSVYQIGSNGCYSPRSTIRLFVNTNPTLALLGNTSVNLGRTAPLQLRFTGVPPFSYTLSDGTTGTANDTLATVSVMPPQTTIYQVATVSNVCGVGLPGNPATATITVRIPTITTGALSTSVLCVGNSLTIPFVTTGEFNSGNAFRVEISTDSTGRSSTTVGVGNAGVAPITANFPQNLSGGLYYVRVVGSNPGIAVLGRPSPVLLNIRPLPSATLTGTQDIYEGNTAKISVNFTGDGPWTFTYADSLRSTQVQTNANPHVLEVRPLRSNTYSLRSVENNCGSGSFSGSAVVRVLPLLGLEDDPLASAVKAYPVPTTSVLTIDIEIPVQRNGAGISLLDAGGRPVLQRTTRDRQTTLDLSQQPAGLYLIQVKIGDRQTTRRVLKQ